MSTETEEAPALTLEQVNQIEKFEVNAVDAIISAVEREALSLASDVSTRKGRDELKAQAYKVSQTKTRIVQLANSSIEEHKAIVTSVTKERVRLEKALDDIRDRVKAPALEWERKEEERKAKIKERIQQIQEQSQNLDGLTVEELTARINEVNRIAREQFDELEEAASEHAEAASAVLVERINARKQYDADQAELKRLKDLEAQREEQDRQRAEKEAADKAEAERKAAELKAAQEAKERAERETKEAEEREEKRKADEAKRIEEAKVEAARAERIRIEAEQKAKDEEAARIAKAKAEEERKAKELAEAKAASEEHRRQVRREAAAALHESSTDLDSAEAASLVLAIEAGEIPHVSIDFSLD